MTRRTTQSTGMDDEQLGRLAHELLDTLTTTITDEGRLAAIMRTLLQVELLSSSTREHTKAPENRTFGQLPGWEECSAEFKATYCYRSTEPPPIPPPETIPEGAVTPRNAWLLKPVIEQAALVRAWSTQDIDRLITSAPGPLTTCLRRLASVAASAHLACQWGCFAAAIPLMYWCAMSLMTMRSRWTSTEKPETNRLYLFGAFALAAVTAAELQHTTLATAIIRRLAANLGAIARAAARIEGEPEADPVFAGPADVLSTIAGLDRPTAAIAALDLARALDVPCGGVGKPETISGSGKIL